MLAILTLLLVIGVSLLITRVATVALTLTGLSRESARFQARSAFTGAGFTTKESESVVTHPVRRRIVMMLMLLGNAGLVTGAATLLLGFVNAGHAGSVAERAGELVGGLLLLLYLARSEAVTRVLERVIERVLRNWTRVEVRDYAGLLHLSGDWRVVEMHVDPEDWLSDRPLNALRLPDEGVAVLGIERSTGRYLGAPAGETCIQAGDVVLLYGREQILADIDCRRRDFSGDVAHQRASTEHRNQLQQEQAEEQVEAPGDAESTGR